MLSEGIYSRGKRALEEEAKNPKLPEQLVKAVPLTEPETLLKSVTEQYKVALVKAENIGKIAVELAKTMPTLLKILDELEILEQQLLELTKERIIKLKSE